MGPTRYASVLGLGFGDCGKGLFVDSLTRRWRAHTVVRFSGGAQAGHGVVPPAEAGGPGRPHVFSQFGAGTLVPGTRTVLLDPMVVHPTALLAEAEALALAGQPDALSRILIDGRCRLTTPCHQAAGRLRELLRGGEAHGTCGVGVGETVRQSQEHPDQALRYADLAGPDSEAREKLRRSRAALLAELEPECPGHDPRVLTELHLLRDHSLDDRWLNPARALARHRRPASLDALREALSHPGAVLFEGAQGVLLDEWRGFHPHTTWSSTTAQAVESATACLELAAPIEHYGVLRVYATRHGHGPFPTHDPALDALLPEAHNQSAGWQGAFRRGHPDSVLLRYAMEAAGPLSGLFVSHLDIFQRGVSLKWCDRYASDDATAAPALRRLPLGRHGDLSHQSALTRLLWQAHPEYDPTPVESATAFLDRLASVASRPVVLQSYGPTAATVRVTGEGV